jgi:hypothetical protein
MLRVVLLMNTSSKVSRNMCLLQGSLDSYLREIFGEVVKFLSTDKNEVCQYTIKQ